MQSLVVKAHNSYVQDFVQRAHLTVARSVLLNSTEKSACASRVDGCKVLRRETAQESYDFDMEPLLDESVCKFNGFCIWKKFLPIMQKYLPHERYKTFVP